MSRAGPAAFPARRNAVLIALVTVFATSLLVAAFHHIEGPVERCEASGGHMLVGPGGETSCVNPSTFLPIETYSADAKGN
ncbi:MAG: hypothetical protein AAGF14_09740 [Pseudomonadota bacterium]